MIQSKSHRRAMDAVDSVPPLPWSVGQDQASEEGSLQIQWQ